MGNPNSIWVNILKSSKELDYKNVRLDALVKTNWRWFLYEILGRLMNWCPLNEKRFLGFSYWTRRRMRWWRTIFLLLLFYFIFVFGLSLASNTSAGRGIQIVESAYWYGEEWNGGVHCCVDNIIDMGTLVIDNTPARWSKDVLIKINAFIWKLLLDKLPNRDNLEKTGLDVPSTLCGKCDDVTETGNHVFLNCQVVWRYGDWWVCKYS